MSAKLPVSDIRAVLEGYASSAANFLGELNQVEARYWEMGIFDQMLHRFIFPTGPGDTGVLALPRQCLSLVGVDFGGAPAAVYNQVHQYQELGIGYMDPDQYSMRGIVDWGDGHPTAFPISSITDQPGKLRFTIENPADAGKTVRLFGTSDTEQTKRIYTSGVLGESLTTVSPFNDTVQSYTDVTGIQIQSGFVGYSQLSYIASDGTVTQLAEYEPGDTRPSFRWYVTGVSNSAVQTICRKRWIPVVNETDWIEPANIGAIKAGFQALSQEDAVQQEQADTLWGRGRAMLEKQLQSLRGSIQTRMPFKGGKTTLTAPMQTR
jgi:hypothetical protein